LVINSCSFLTIFIEVLNSFPQVKENEYNAREVASLYRSDFVLFSSDYEQMRVKRAYQLENTGCLGFSFEDKDIEAPLQYNFLRRHNFAWMGKSI